MWDDEEIGRKIKLHKNGKALIEDMKYEYDFLKSTKSLPFTGNNLIL